MAGVNKAILVGNLGRDPEARTLQNGEKVVSFSLATSESWTDKNTGERKEKVQWHRIAIFNPNLADLAEKHLAKGSQVYLEGQIQSRKYTDKDGVERETTEIVLGRVNAVMQFIGQAPDRRESSSAQPAESRGAARGSGRPPARQPANAPNWDNSSNLDDDIPF